MNIIALLSWYDENPAWLARCVRSLHLLPVDHLVAVDGAYRHYPDAKARSDTAQREAIETTCETLAVPYTLFTPTEPWESEIAKRNRMFELAETTATPDRDWYFVIDSDEHVTHAPTDVHHQLERTVFHVAATTLTEPGWPLGTMVYPTHPKFFRAIPGLRVVANHYTYQAPDGRRLWGNAKTNQLEPRHDLTAVRVEHTTKLRHSDRAQAAQAYYETRDDLGLEHDLPADRTALKAAAA